MNYQSVNDEIVLKIIWNSIKQFCHKSLTIHFVNDTNHHVICIFLFSLKAQEKNKENEANADESHFNGEFQQKHSKCCV